MNEKISPWLLDKIMSGKVVLFLGAGASFGAKSEDGSQPISGNQLRDLICDKFLGGEQKDKSLVQVADYAKYQSSLTEVQVFVKDQFQNFQPASFHKLIPTFKWHSIFTTNYDLIVERAYDQVTKRLQILKPILRDGDQFSEAISNPEFLPYFKLHGCITVVSDKNLPLILASEEYAKHKANRIRLFRHLSDFGVDNPIIFCGYQLSDPNIQQILFDLTDAGIHRPTYMVVDPGLNKFDIQMWSANRITPRTENFSEFIEHLDATIDTNKRVLGKVLVKEEAPFFKLFRSSLEVSKELVHYLSTELEYIYPGIPTEGAKPLDFYRGLDGGWGGISEGLDINRRVVEQVLLDAVICDEASSTKTFLIKGHAGSGKSVSLKRIAWNAVNELSTNAVVLREGAVLRPSLLKELFSCIEGRLIFFVDGAIENKDDLLKFYSLVEQEGVSATVLTTARSNEWNQLGDTLDGYITAEYEIDRLSSSEIDELVQKLNEHNCLVNLRSVNLEEIKKSFDLTSDRQLLVALHEATAGKPFEQIVLDEYERITPLEAKILYLDICTLNRLGVPVRAGLISRISGIDIDSFNKYFLMPLEHVVKVFMDQRSRDYVYVSRHPLIAGFVFDQALSDPSDKATQIIRVIRHMNIDYDADMRAFSALIRGKTLAKVFGDKALANRVYDAAEEAGAPLSYIWHQKAVFEFNHPGCDIRASLSAISKAEKLLPENRTDRAILHTKALIFKRLAKESNIQIETEKYRSEARLILERLVRNQTDSRPLHGLAELHLDELGERLIYVKSGEGATDLEKRALLEKIKAVEDTIYKGLQKFPGDEYLSMAKVDLSKKLQDFGAARELLEKAYANNDASDFVTINLARQRRSDNDIDGAIELLRNGINKNPTSKPFHLHLAKFLIDKNDESFNEEIMHHLKRSFSPGDSNYDAQFWYARQLYISGGRSESSKLFDALKKAKLSPYQKGKMQGIVHNSVGNPAEYDGHIISEHVSFYFIRSAELADSVFAHASVIDESALDKLRVGSNTRFNLGFTMKGPTACNVAIKS
jgi:cold shock CspA family protein